MNKPITEEKVYDFATLSPGDVIWFSGYWVKLAETRVKGEMSMVHGTWLTPGSSGDPIDMFAFKTGTVSTWPVTRRLKEREYLLRYCPPGEPDWLNVSFFSLEAAEKARKEMQDSGIPTLKIVQVIL